MATHILNDITTQFSHATLGWHGYLFPIAHKLFGALAVIELAWAALWWTIEKQDVTSLWRELLKCSFVISIFYTLLMFSPQWLSAIINSFIDIGAGASGHTQLYPSAIVDQGVSIASNIFKVFHDKGFSDFGLPTIIGFFTGFLTLLAFCIIAGFLVVTLVESYFVLGATVLMLGFGASRLTRDSAVKCFSYAMAVGVKLFMLYLVLGVGATLADGWISQFNNMTEDDLTPFLEIMAGSLVYVMCALMIPLKAQSLASGMTNATLGNVIAAASTATTVAGAAGGLVKGAASGAMGAASSGMQAMKQAHSVAQNTGGGAMGYAAGTAAAGFNLAASAAGKLAGRTGSMSQSMRQKTDGLNTHFAQRAETKAASRPFQTPPPTTNTGAPAPSANPSSGVSENGPAASGTLETQDSASTPASAPPTSAAAPDTKPAAPVVSALGGQSAGDALETVKPAVTPVVQRASSPRTTAPSVSVPVKK